MEIGQLGEANLTTSPVLSEQLVEAPEHLAGGGLGHVLHLCCHQLWHLHLLPTKDLEIYWLWCILYGGTCSLKWDGASAGSRPSACWLCDPLLLCPLHRVTSGSGLTCSPPLVPSLHPTHAQCHSTRNPVPVRCGSWPWGAGGDAHWGVQAPYPPWVWGKCMRGPGQHGATAGQKAPREEDLHSGSVRPSKRLPSVPPGTGQES